MKSAITPRRVRIAVWLIWAVACLVFLLLPECVLSGRFPGDAVAGELPALPGALLEAGQWPYLFPWRCWYRLRKWAWARYYAFHRAHQRALWVARVGRLALTGALTMAQVVDLLTQSQLRRQLGALPVLYALLDILQVRQTINRHCPTAAEVDHGTVALVLILNRLTTPRALYRIADWLAQTVLVKTMGIPAVRFNDDRLGRTLEAISVHSRDIWLDIVHHALVRFDIDLSLVFYDLTAFVVQGEYANSDLADFGFAHNTPMNRRKIKLGLDTVADGNIPVDYWPWSGRTADLATVQQNMERLCRLLKQRGWPVQETVLIGDRANLNDELAFAYDDHQLRYLAGLQPRTTPHRDLLKSIPTRQFYAHPLDDGHWGVPVPVVFERNGRQVTHRGLIILSGPMRAALRQTRAKQMWNLRQDLLALRANIGQPHYRTVKCMQRHANALLKRSPTGRFIRAQAEQDTDGHVCLCWWANRYALWQADQHDGRYLLVTNDWRLSPQQMLICYRQKDGGEKRFTVCKSDLKVSPIYLHKDDRIEGMLLIHMLALLTYSLLERQAHQNELHLTTRRIIETLENLTVIETLCWDGSRLCRLTPIDEQQAALIQALQTILMPLYCPRSPHPLLDAGDGNALLLLPVSAAQPQEVAR